MKRIGLLSMVGFLLLSFAGTACATEIKWSLMGDESPMWVDVIMKYQKKTGNTVKITYCRNESDLTNTLLDSPPDIISMNPSQMTEYVDMGIFANISSYLAGDKRYLSSFIPSLVKAYSNGKKIYAIPWNAQITSMRYNQDLFKKAGIKPPTASWRYTTEYYQAMKKLSKDTNGDRQNDQWGLVGIPIADWTPLIYSFGAKFISDDGKKFLFTGKEAVSSLDFIKKLHVEGLARTWDWNSDDRSKIPFIDGKVGTVITSGRFVSGQMKFKMGMVATPKGPGGSFTSVDASGLGVFNKSKKKKQAVDFIKFLTSADTQILLFQKGQIMPTVLSAIESREISNSKTVIDQSILKALPKAKSMSANPIMRNGFMLNRGLGEVIDGTTSVTDFIQQMKERIEERLASSSF